MPPNAPQTEGSPLLVIVYLIFAVLMIVSLWKVFDRAGYPGWGAIVPIYNWYIMLEIAGKPIWWLLLFFVPIVNIVIVIIVSIGIAEHFGRSAGFGVGLALLPIIFYPILAFTEDPR